MQRNNQSRVVLKSGVDLQSDLMSETQTVGATSYNELHMVEQPGRGLVSRCVKVLKDDSA
jgi:hypothetical protein